MAGYILRRLLQVIPVLLGTTFLIWSMVFLMPGDPLIGLFGDKTPPPPRSSTRFGSTTGSTSLVRPVLHVSQRHLPRRLRHVLLGRAGDGHPRSHLPGHAPSRAARSPHRDGVRHLDRPHLGPAQGRHLRRERPRREPHPHLAPGLRRRVRRAVHLRRAARLVQNDRRSRGAMGRPDPSGDRARDHQLRADRPTHARVGHRHRGGAGLRPHRREQGPPSPSHRARAHPAQLAHPRRDLSRRRLRRAHGRSDRHRGIFNVPASAIRSTRRSSEASRRPSSPS